MVVLCFSDRLLANELRSQHFRPGELDFCKMKALKCKGNLPENDCHRRLESVFSNKTKTKSSEIV